MFQLFFILLKYIARFVHDGSQGGSHAYQYQILQNHENEEADPTPETESVPVLVLPDILMDGNNLGMEEERCTNTGGSSNKATSMGTDHNIPSTSTWTMNTDDIPNSNASMRTNTGSTVSTNPEPKAKKRLRHCIFNEKWLGEYDWLAQCNDNTAARCLVCESTFSVKYDGVDAVLQHSHGKKHKLKVSAKKACVTMSKFFVPMNKKLEKQVAVVKCTKMYHTVHHAHSYLSADCENKLDATLFHDLEIASKPRLGRTKQEAIVENVLLPASIESALKELGNQPFSVATDASNKKNRKMFPVCICFFDKDLGICERLVDFIEQADESADAIFRSLVRALNNLNIKEDRVVAYGADNAPVNYRVNESVFTKLREKQPFLIKGNCNCHILHDTAKYTLKMLKFDVETLCKKVFNEFSHSAKNVVELKECFQFVEQEYHEVLRTVPIRWLSLICAVDRLLLNWPSIKMYFLNEGLENCDPLIRSFLESQEHGYDEEDEKYLTLSECYIYFTQHFMSLFDKPLKLLQKSDASAFILYDTTMELKNNLLRRETDLFAGFKVCETLMQKV